MESALANGTLAVPRAVGARIGSSESEADVPRASPTAAFLLRLEERNALLRRLTEQLAQGAKLARQLEAARESLRLGAGPNIAEPETLMEDQASAADLLIYRYIKLQDLLAECLFPSLLEAGAEAKSDSAFGEKLRVLQRLGVIYSADDWLELRALRNEMGRPDVAPDVFVALVHDVLNSVATLTGALRAANHYARSKLGV